MTAPSGKLRLKRYLRRYTDVLSAIDMLRHHRIVLLDPKSWADQNDSLGVERYRRQTEAGRAYAYCMTEASETAHHWQIFAGHAHGVCVVFHRAPFLKNLNERAGVLHGPMKYMNLTELQAAAPYPAEDLPFLKRSTFEAEEEYRVLATEDAIFAGDTYEVPIKPALVERIVLGPSMPAALGDTLKDILCEQGDCSHLKVTRSKLWNNEVWRREIMRASQRITAA